VSAEHDTSRLSGFCDLRRTAQAGSAIRRWHGEDLVPAGTGERGCFVETSGFFADPNGIPPAPEQTDAQPFEPSTGADQLTAPWQPEGNSPFAEAYGDPTPPLGALAPVAFAPAPALNGTATGDPTNYLQPEAAAATAYAAPFASPVVPDATSALQPLSTLPASPLPDTTKVGMGLQQPEGDPFPANGSAYEQAPLVEGLSLTDLLVTVLERGASDLHLTAGARPTLRLNGSLSAMEDRPVLTPPVLQQMMYEILTQKQRERFEEELELDFAYAVPGRARFRVNLYRQREALGAAFRLIPYEIKKLEDLGVPPSVSNFAMMPRGFVLVTGPTGSGKSTTLAGIIDLANRQRRDHIMTVEDPIEFLHQHKSCLVNQREVGDDTRSFGNALKHVLRQDPDIILVGEMRDLETISVALTAAETGHLVFATLHTQDAAQTIDRVIDVFPPHQQQQVRVQLAGSLQGVVAQTLCKTADGRGRVVATEVLVATPAIRNLIREGKTHQIYSALQAGARHGMHTMDQHLAELQKAGRITYEAALEKCHHVEDFNRLAGRG
jgi:twitching motility protein PilT